MCEVDDPWLFDLYLLSPFTLHGNSKPFSQALRNLGIHSRLHRVLGRGVLVEPPVMVSKIFCRHPHLVVIPVHFVTIKPEIDDKLY